jgi:hypothetical protein
MIQDERRVCQHLAKCFNASTDFARSHNSQCYAAEN